MSSDSHHDHNPEQDISTVREENSMSNDNTVNAMTERNQTPESIQSDPPENESQPIIEETAANPGTGTSETLTEEPAVDPEPVDPVVETGMIDPVIEPAIELAKEETVSTDVETATGAIEIGVKEIIPEPATRETETTEEPQIKAPPRPRGRPKKVKPPVEESVAAEPLKVEEPKAVTDLEVQNPSDAILIKEITDTAPVTEEEEEEEEEHAEEELVEKFDTYSREKLVELLEKAVEEVDVQKIKTRVALIKVAFLKLTKDNEHKRYDEFIREGGAKEGYTASPDTLLERFNNAFDIYKKNKIKYNEEQEVLKLRNLDAKKQILEELKELVSSEESLKKTYDKFKELQVKWKEIGLVPATEINNLWQNYHFLVEKFFDKVKISKELRDLDLKKNFEKKIELCEKAEELLIETSIIKSFKQLQKYHEEWKEIGPVPADKREEIWERFKTATDKINDRRREHYSQLTEQQESNLLAKTALCDKAEQLVAEEISSLKDWQDKTAQINELFRVWKSIGPATKKENDAIWERFKTYLNTFFSNKKEFYGKLKEEQINNYNIKLDICQQAEALKDSTDWRNTTQDLINLQKEWKNIGPVPRKHSDKIWKRFRSACDEFFNRKSEFFTSVEANEKENLDKKLDLIRKVEEYKFGKDKNENLEILKGFQREWTEIGHVPIKEKNKIHNSFREAVNKQLDKLNISSVEMRKIDYQNRLEAMVDDPNSNRLIRKEMGFLSGKISKLREDISLWENNIGFLAHSKTADILRKEFEKKIDQAKEELALSEAKLKYIQQSID
jgi:hypothetical protein